MHFSKTILLAAVACLAPVVSHAAPVAAGTSFSVGGLNFSNFGCTVNYLHPTGTIATPTACDQNQISVEAISQPGIAGISFTSGFTAEVPNTANPSAQAFSDAVLSYSVSSSTGISSVGLDFNGYFDGLAITSVTEDVYNGDQWIKSVRVSCDAVSGCNKSDTIDLGGMYTSLNIKKDINVSASYAGVAQASYIDQTFTATPEPGSTALLGSGLLAIAGLLRRRSIMGMFKK